MKCFLYGTLMRNPAGDHDLMEGQHYVGPAVTEPHYLLFRVAHFPGLVEAAPGKPVQGQLWEISDMRLKTLDRYEGVPYLYKRLPVRLSSHPDMVVQAYIYQGDISDLSECGVAWK